MSKMILIIEDEESIQNIIRAFLEDAGYTVVLAADGLEGIEQFRANKPDLVLLDLMLPKIDGFAVCEILRKESHVPIIMLTALDDDDSQMKGFDALADDYITKPFSPSELLARVDALYRRLSFSKRDEGKVYRSGPFALDLVSRTCTKDNIPIELTQVEFMLMKVFLENKNVALSRAMLLNKVWGDDSNSEEKTVDVNMRRLRMKIEDTPSEPKYITTLWGFGYKWTEE